MICALVAGIYTGLRFSGFLKSTFLRRTFFVGTIAFLIITVFSSNLLFHIPFLDNPLIRSLILRDDNPYGYVDAQGRAFSVAVRSWMLGQHIDLAMSNPFFGVGTFLLADTHSGYGLFESLGVLGSEAYLTGTFARIGLPFVLLLYVIFFAKRPIAEGQADFVRCMKLFLFLAMIFYGSFINPYDLIFLLMMVAIAGGVVSRGHASPKVTPEMASDKPGKQQTRPA